MASCGKCGTENKDGVKFCRSCGASMAAPAPEAGICATCASPLAPGAKFCRKCGVNVAAAAPPAAPEPAPAPLPPQEPPVSLAKKTGFNFVPPVPAAPAPGGPDTWAVPADLPVKSASPAAPVPARPPKSRQPALMLSAAAAAVAVLAAGALWYWWPAHKADTVAVQPLPADPAGIVVAAPEPTPAPPPPPPVNDPAGLAEALEAPSPAPVVEAAPEIAPPVPARPGTPAPERKRATVAADVPDVMAGKVRSLLGKADGYIANRQYDKAMAMAESALELDPSSGAARAMISKAKARQMEALKSGSSID